MEKLTRPLNLHTRELRLKAIIRNNRLVTAREQLGFTPRQAAEKIGVTYQLLLKLEGCYVSPLGHRNTWRPAVLKIARYYGHTPEFLFPEAVIAVEKRVAEVELSGEEVARLLPRAELPCSDTENPFALLEEKKTVEILRDAVARLPHELQFVITARFGLDGDEPQSLEQVGTALGCCRERTRQLEVKALELLQFAQKLEHRVPPQPTGWGGSMTLQTWRMRKRACEFYEGADLSSKAH